MAPNPRAGGYAGCCLLLVGVSAVISLAVKALMSREAALLYMGMACAGAIGAMR